MLPATTGQVVTTTTSQAVTTPTPSTTGKPRPHLTQWISLLSQPLPNAHHAGIVQVDSVSNLITIGLPVILTILFLLLIIGAITLVAVAYLFKIHRTKQLKIPGTESLILCIQCLLTISYSTNGGTWREDPRKRLWDHNLDYVIDVKTLRLFFISIF